ncbi:hypothetical protein JTT07_04935 [Clostridium botulinum]|nr:hypothetical protein [Clostridium botulinum]MCS4479208.1 hypothetical protein [Clostridium botulinum]MCS4517359.1 hypothetical protein [Clostridium botulinum]MCS4523659.1 hypothetical protein [Clostridium botulinum]MCS4526212.1 hypothetical protein [Clostridium botulinum]
MFRNNELILHYVYNVSGVLGPAKFYQVKSKDGINWKIPKNPLIFPKKFLGF